MSERDNGDGDGHFTLHEVVTGQVEVLGSDEHDERATSLRAALGRMSEDRKTRMLEPDSPVLPHARGDRTGSPFTFHDRARRAADRFNDAASQAPDTWLEFVDDEPEGE